MHRVALPGPPAPTCLSVPQGELTITTDMEDLSTALFYDTVPETWMARAYPSMMGLAAWYTDLLLRIRVRMGSLASVHPRSQSPWEHAARGCVLRPVGPLAWPSSEQGREGVPMPRRRQRRTFLPGKENSCLLGMEGAPATAAQVTEARPLLGPQFSLRGPTVPTPQDGAKGERWHGSSGCTICREALALG